MIPFHPCGMICDWVRTGYRAKMRLWRGDDEEIEVVWFRAAPGAKYLPGPHPFTSWWTWDRKDGVPAQVVGEQRYLGYHDGSDPVGYRGVDHCGSDAAVRNGGVHGVDPDITTDADGYSECCGDRPNRHCGVLWPDNFILDNGTVAHCPCVSGSMWDMAYLGEGPPSIGGPGKLVWGTDSEVYQFGVGSGEPPAGLPHWGGCNYAPPIDAPARVQFWAVLDLATCQLTLQVRQFWWKPDVSSGVAYASGPVAITEGTEFPIAFPAITSMHFESCGDSTGGGNPIYYTLTPAP